MADMFFNSWGKFFFYLAMILYLYGDLAIYDAAVSKSLRDTICTYFPNETTSSSLHNLTESDPCFVEFWPSLTRMNAYRIFVFLFNALVGWLVFFNMQKTKWLQLATTIMRWLAFGTMITLATGKIVSNSDQSTYQPALVNFRGLPNF